jgi:hypothetical protein
MDLGGHTKITLTGPTVPLDRGVMTLSNFLRHPLQMIAGDASGDIQSTRLLLGKLLSNQVKALGPKHELRDAEFSVFSQWGDDGIIQYLIHNVPIENDTFIEFGVEDYTEANTRFLLLNDNWRGLIMDASAENMARVRRENLYWRHDLTAINEFISKDNINQLISGAGFGGPIGLLSIDLDGNDYWIWETINVIDPAIVIVEYNSVFGSKNALSVPYDPAFRRMNAHWSYLFWGCSLRALCVLAERKGYVFVGSNSNGNNAYFVKRELSSGIRIKTAEEGYVTARYRDSRDRTGKLSFVSGEARLALISDLMVMDVEHDVLVRLGDV